MQKLKKILGSVTSFTSVILVLMILFLINFISTRNFKRIDLTSDQQYTISKATISTLNSLEDLITVKVFFSKKLPPDLTELSQYVKDILEEYTAYSKGNLKVIYADPAEDDVLKNEVRSLGIPELQMNVLEKDKFQVQNGYLGIGIFYEDKQEILPVVQDPSSLEYDLTSAIKKVSAESVKVIGFLTGHGEHLTYQGSSREGKNDYTLVRRELEKNYKVENVVIENGQKIENIDTLIIAGPTESFSERDLFEIDQFILQGGQAIFLLDGVKVEEGLMASKNETGLEKLIENYGVKVNQDLVLDRVNETVSFSSGFMQFIVPYPFWPKLTNEYFDSENLIVSRLDSLVLAWASSLEKVEKTGLETKILATTSKFGGKVKDEFDLNPNQDFQIKSALEKINLVALSTGKFQSYFTNQSIPPVVLSPSSNDGGFGLAEKTSQTDDADRVIVTESQQTGKILVVGDSDFATDSSIQRFAQNGVFLLNAVDYLTLDSELMTIRLRGLTERNLDELSEKEKLTIKFIGIALVPILIALFGITKAILRRKIKQISN